MRGMKSVSSCVLHSMAFLYCLAIGVLLPGKDSHAADPRTVKAAEQLLEASGVDAMLDAIWPSITVMLKTTFNAQHPRKEKEVDAVISAFIQEFNLSRNELIRKFAEKYSEKFSYDELLFASNFYNSPIGRKFVEMNPVLVAELNKIAAEYSQQIIIRVRQKNTKLFEALSK